MTRLMVLCEGLTEEHFVNACLKPHLEVHSVFACASRIGRNPRKRGGHVSAQRLASHIGHVYHSMDCVTTFVDYYGFVGQGGRTKEEVERSILEEAEAQLGFVPRQERLVPYVQRHEFVVVQ